MPALITDDMIVLQPDNLGYQAFRIPLEEQPQDANVMVFYYKAYADLIQASTNENGSGYIWNNDSFFGLSFTGTMSANTGGIIGWTNGTSDTVVYTSSLNSYAPWNEKTPYSRLLPVAFESSTSTISYGHPTPNTRSTIGTNGGYFCPATTEIGLSAVENFLGILKIAKHPTDVQRIVIAFGINWENLQPSSYSHALSSLNTSWLSYGMSVTETTYSRSNYQNVALSNTINFPRWIVGKWSSAVSDRKVHITSMKVEYYETYL